MGEILGSISAKFDISRIIYANGPGSFMGLKVAYLTLCTFCITRGIEFYGVDGFSLNGARPIRANKNMSFVLENGVISLQKVKPCEFELPLNLDGLELVADALPNYVIDAV